MERTSLVEESKVLRDRFLTALGVYEVEKPWNKISYAIAKEAALMCITEQIGSLQGIHISVIGDGYFIIDDEIQRLKKIKLEIEKL